MRPRSETWQDRAACRTVDPELFFSDDAGHYISSNAIRICSSCPVKVECLQFALDNDERFGVFGGTTPNQRAHMLGRSR